MLAQVQPQELERRRILLAPYAFEIVQNAYLPLLRPEWKKLHRRFENPQAAPLELLYEFGVSGARAALRERGQQLDLVDLGISAWDPYFSEPAHFLSVSVDGIQHYSVPERDALQKLGVDVDYVVVLGSIRFERSGSDSSCEVRFLIWDCQRLRAITEGKAEASVTRYDNVTLGDWQHLASALTQEIFSRRPFTQRD
jgi:hypothetical protein